MLYRLDGALIALSVLDLLPHAVSGVYFLYDPAYSKYSLGKISAMREIALAEEEGYEFYYMGYWIEGCGKMRYKGGFGPQMVLEPEENRWGSLEVLEGRLRGKREEEGVKKVGEDGEKVREDEDKVTDEGGEGLGDGDRDGALTTPTAVRQSGRSLLDVGFAGIETMSTILSELAMGAMKVQIGRGLRKQTVQLDRLMSWEDGDYLDAGSLKGVVAELVACLGLEVARECVVDLS